MSQLVQDVSRSIKTAFPSLDGLWYIKEASRPKSKNIVYINLFACDGVNDLISEENGVYSIGEHTGSISEVMEKTNSWAALARVAANLPKIRALARQAAPINFYGNDYKYLGVFEVIPGYSHGIITLRHETLGTYYATGNNEDVLRQLDNWLAILAI